MNDPYGPVAWPNGTGDDLPDRIWTHGDFTPVQEFPAAELTSGYTSGAFIKAALRRRARFWLATAFIGLLIGFGLYVKFPPAYHATATIVLTNSPNENPTAVMQTNATLAESVPVAQRALEQLGLKQSVASFMATYTATPTTDQVLVITAGARSASTAVTRANALAAAFLQFRTAYVETQQAELVTELNQQLQQAQQHLDSVNSQLSQVSAEPSSPTQQANLRKLQAQDKDANNALAEVKYYVVGTQATGQTTTDSIVQDSKILGPATLAKHSGLKGVVLDVVGGLLGGMVLGMAIVVIGALVSDRLRRRDEVAEAFSVPVGLSVGVLNKRGLGRAARDLDMKRVVSHLRNAVPGSSRGPASLAVVAVDDTRVAARAVASLAMSYASEGRQVVAADLSGGAHLARLLGVKGPGVHAVSREGMNFLLTVPEPDDVALVGPLRGGSLSAVPAQADKALVDASNSADVLLTLTSLDPALGSEYLATWATDAVGIVTAGESSQERIRGVREMMRMSGTRLDSVVLVGADKRDQSIGASSALDESLSFWPV